MSRFRFVPVVFLGLALLPFAAATPLCAADAPAERVVAMYFHRTQRCPTCQKMGSYAEEAVRSGFASEMAEGKVAFYFIDFQNEKNSALAKGYQVTGPALVVARIAGPKVVAHENLKEIWAKAADKPGFVAYVQEHVAAQLKR